MEASHARQVGRLNFGGSAHVGFNVGTLRAVKFLFGLAAFTAYMVNRRTATR